MVEIECPHCDEDIELDDFGLFDCPHCDEEFIWEDEDDEEDVSNEHAVIGFWDLFGNTVKAGLGIIGIGLLLLGIFFVWVMFTFTIP